MTPLPQKAEQSESLALVHPTGQHPSPGAHLVHRHRRALDVAARGSAAQHVEGARDAVVAGRGAVAVAGLPRVDDAVAAEGGAVPVGGHRAALGAAAVAEDARLHRRALAGGRAVLGRPDQRVGRAGVPVVARGGAVAVAGLALVTHAVAAAVSSVRSAAPIRRPRVGRQSVGGSVGRGRVEGGVRRGGIAAPAASPRDEREGGQRGAGAKKRAKERGRGEQGRLRGRGRRLESTPSGAAASPRVPERGTRVPA